MANLTPAALIAIAVGIVIIALLIGYFMGTRFGGKKSVAMREANEKHDSYKNDVREHFEQTSAIMSRMVEDYRDMYRHMADGAQKLADIHPEKQVTPPPQPEAITEGSTGKRTDKPGETRTGAGRKAAGKDAASRDPAGIQGGETLGAADPAKGKKPAQAKQKDNGVKDQPKAGAAAHKPKDNKPVGDSAKKPAAGDKKDVNTGGNSNAEAGKKSGKK